MAGTRARLTPDEHNGAEKSAQAIVEGGCTNPGSHFPTPMLSAFRYYWMAAKGYRVCPWRSPYIRWRMETFFGPEADPLTAGRLCRLLWRERRRLREFLRWAEEYRRL